MAEYGVDFSKVLDRHRAFWQGRLSGPLFSVVAPKEGRKPFPYPENEADRINWWTDPQQVIARFRDEFKGTYYAGDAFPVLNHNLGPAGHAGFFKGAVPRYESSIWYEPTLENYADLEFDPESFLYRKTLELAKAYAQDAKGEYIVSMPDTVGAADVLSHLRGPDRFMMDFYDKPDEVRAALKKVQAVWEKAMQAVWSAVKDNNYGGGSVGWLNTWAPGFHGQLQCDCSVMLSPEMFGEFICFELEAQSGFLEYSLYHFDGEAQIRHLPHLLSVNKIDAIQWTNVVGQQPVTAYTPVLKEIQQAGKKLILHCAPDEVGVLLESLDGGLMSVFTWAKTQAEADYLVRLYMKR